MKDEIQSQYSSSLNMLKSAIEKCPNSLWTDKSYTNVFWQLSYHTLFYTDLYLSEKKELFQVWEKHKDNYENLGRIGEYGEKLPEIKTPYSKPEILLYHKKITKTLSNRVKKINFNSHSGFDWLNFNKVELQFYNLRHLQHHTGQLCERIRQNTEERVGWVRLEEEL
ncbi:hypothetical protein [Aquimarina macrocephali]|uniref:hypothetical protein n=1 Tax=Aquimarina macrocephali TaxID=666563 RepID=UPI0004665A0B|nr:hypothetical protein [Aquimarina macrocephali]